MTAENGTSVVGAEPARDSLAPPDLPEHPGSSLRDALLTIGALMAVLVAVELAVPAAGVVSAASILDGVAVAAFTVTGLIAWHRRPHNRIGRLMVAAAAALWAAGMADDDVAGMQAVGVALESLPLAVLLHLLLAFPSGRVVGRAATATLAAVYLIALVLQVPQYLDASPEVQTAAWNVQAILGLTSMAVVFVLVSRRLATAPPVLRRQLGPFIGYGCVALVIIAVTIGALHLSEDPDIATPVILVQVAAASAFPVAFVIGMLAGAFGRAGELEEVARGISEASADPALLDELIVRALGDPSARVYWPESGRFVDSAGNPAPGDPAGADPHIAGSSRDPGRGWWPIGDPRNPAGALGYDTMLIADADLVATVSAPLALAIDNRSLVVALRAAVNELAVAAEQVRTSRRRIVIAADTERRRIARDLHDGAQQRIVLIGIEAQRIGRRAQDPDFVRSVADRVSEQLRLLLDELRALVHGIMPATLQERGLHAGIAALADQMPMPVRVEVIGTLDRMAAEVESTGYFVVAEALTNAAKHASAQQVRIVLVVRDGRLEVIVSDDGEGTGPVVAGFGLRSLQDRVAALDGTVTVQSRPAGGTTLRAEFACG
jgi:signal transduction histidine kinase